MASLLWFLGLFWWTGGNQNAGWIWFNNAIVLHLSKSWGCPTSKIGINRQPKTTGETRTTVHLVAPKEGLQYCPGPSMAQEIHPIGPTKSSPLRLGHQFIPTHPPYKVYPIDHLKISGYNWLYLIRDKIMFWLINVDASISAVIIEQEW